MDRICMLHDEVQQWVLVKTAMNLWVPSKAVNFFTSWIIYFSKKHCTDGNTQAPLRKPCLVRIKAQLPITKHNTSLHCFTETCTFVFGYSQISTLWSCHTNMRAKSYGSVFRTERKFSKGISLQSVLISADQPSRCGALHVNSIEITISGLLPWRRSPSVLSRLASVTSISFTHEIWALYHPRFPSVTQKFTAPCEISIEYVALCPSSCTDLLIAHRLWQG
jgi:hypothetical protein